MRTEMAEVQLAPLAPSSPEIPPRSTHKDRFRAATVGAARDRRG